VAALLTTTTTIITTWTWLCVSDNEALLVPNAVGGGAGEEKANWML